MRQECLSLLYCICFFAFSESVQRSIWKRSTYLSHLSPSRAPGIHLALALAQVVQAFGPLFVGNIFRFSYRLRYSKRLPPLKSNSGSLCCFFSTSLFQQQYYTCQRIAVAVVTPCSTGGGISNTSATMAGLPAMHASSSPLVSAYVYAGVL